MVSNAGFTVVSVQDANQLTKNYPPCTLLLSCISKRKERQSAIQRNGKLSTEGKAKWMKVMRNDVMSSEESGDDGKNIIRPLKWRSEYVDKMFDKIDQYYGAHKSPQALRQTKERVIGEPSDRCQPQDLPDWAIKRANSC